MFKEKISFRIKGKEADFIEGTDIRALGQSLVSFQKMIEKVYLYSEGRAKMTDSDYENLKIQLQNPRSGSWTSDICIDLKSLVLPLTPFILQNSGDIMETIYNVYKFLIYKIKAKDEDKKLSIQITDNSGPVYVIHENDGSVIINTPPDIPQLSEELAPLIQKITKNIDGQAISEVEIGNSKDIIHFDLTDAQRFKTHTFTSDVPIKVSGIIRDAKADTYSGVIKITKSQDPQVIKGEEYHFSSQNLFSEEKFKSVYLIEHQFLIKKRIAIGPKNNFDGTVKSLIIDGFE
ncbi:hypothetical protein [Streptococcus porcinus]|uniref:Uncharacterized protein n=1 Tax=Streptococcus porcinus TaxID=1340 RepID=A0A7V9WRD7_STRPO|nr:hypothetical protein [Streptococcus porcinus]MBA2795662.1 hypothetical protein [Streptococcus porcinus]